jgi:predicted heme/steroid binding protein
MNKIRRYYAIKSLFHRNIQYYKNMLMMSNDEYQKTFYKKLLNREIEKLNNWEKHNQSKVKNIINQSNQSSESVMAQGVQMTIEELAQYNGSNGKPAYVAVNGIIYDVSLQPVWGGGTHFSLYAGKDLTNEFGGCHSDRVDILKLLPKVGMVKS